MPQRAGDLDKELQQSLRRDPQRGTMIVTVELPMDTGELLEKALDKARDDARGWFPYRDGYSG